MNMSAIYKIVNYQYLNCIYQLQKSIENIVIIKYFIELLLLAHSNLMVTQAYVPHELWLNRFFIDVPFRYNRVIVDR